MHRQQQKTPAAAGMPALIETSFFEAGTLVKAGMLTTAWTPETAGTPTATETKTRHGRQQQQSRQQQMEHHQQQTDFLNLGLKILLSILLHLAFPFS